MVSSGMLRRVVLVRTNVSEEPHASLVFLRSVRRLLVAASAVSSSLMLVTLMIGSRFLRNVGSYKSHTA
jgi:hypothetical protein